MAETQVTSDQLFGIAKKITRDLEELPLQSHLTIVQMISQASQHRHVCYQRQVEEEQAELRRRQMEFQQRQYEQQQNEAALNTMRPELVKQ